MLDSMTEKQRRIMVLYCVYGYKQEEIADMLGIVVSTVNEHIKTAEERAKIVKKNFFE